MLLPNLIPNTPHTKVNPISEFKLGTRSKAGSAFSSLVTVKYTAVRAIKAAAVLSLESRNHFPCFCFGNREIIANSISSGMPIPETKARYFPVVPK